VRHPDPALAVALETLAAGSRIVRVHHRRFGPAEFDAPRALPLGRPVVPALYAARDDDTGLVESLFHDVPLHGPRRLVRAALAERVLSRLAPVRDLRLITLRDRELIEAPASAYAWTAAWGAALHAATPEADGMIWMARRPTYRPVMVLFGDRIAAGELTVTTAPIPLWHGPGLELAEQAAMRADIALLL
jgi:hypothetical protein